MKLLVLAPLVKNASLVISLATLQDQELMCNMIAKLQLVSASRLDIRVCKNFTLNLEIFDAR